MRLINTRTLAPEHFLGDVPEYAILSHTWDDEEVTFQDLSVSNIAEREGYAKLENSANLAKQEGYGYIWIDTCYINTLSSAELSEAINSMFQWYKGAARCFAYLSDVNCGREIQDSRWFKRGWTLQELIAPKDVRFYDKSWNFQGDKNDLKDKIHSATGISEDVLLGAGLSSIPACRKMSWASTRATTRPEDVAYCLMGLFDVNMPLLYGEGAEKAFRRLQEAFVKESDDESIFAWTVDPAEVPGKPYWGLLATSPTYFKHSGPYGIPRFKAYRHGGPTEITNRGLRISVILQAVEHDGSGTLFLAALNCSRVDHEKEDISNAFTITLQKLSEFEDQYARVRPDAIKSIRIFPSGVSPGNSPEQQDLQVSQLFIRSIPKKTDPVAGFCVKCKQSVQFDFPTNSPNGPGSLVGHADATFGDESITGPWEIRSSLDTQQFLFIELGTSTTKFDLDALDVENLRQRKILGCLKIQFRSRIEDEGPPPCVYQMQPGSASSDVYLVVGFEPLPVNNQGTPAAFVQPWYSFTNSVDEDILDDLISGSSVRSIHTAPGSCLIKVCFKATTHRFRTLYEVTIANSEE